VQAEVRRTDETAALGVRGHSGPTGCTLETSKKTRSILRSFDKGIKGLMTMRAWSMGLTAFHKAALRQFFVRPKDQKKAFNLEEEKEEEEEKERNSETLTGKKNYCTKVAIRPARRRSKPGGFVRHVSTGGGG